MNEHTKNKEINTLNLIITLTPEDFRSLIAKLSFSSLLKPESPLVGTGIESDVALDSGVTIVAKRNGIKTWTTTYNDGRVETEYWDKDGFKSKEKTTSATLTIDDCIDQMSREEVDAAINRN